MATSLENFVNQVRNHSNQSQAGALSKLADFVTNSLDLLTKNIQHLDNCLETLDIQQHSLGVLAILLVKSGQPIADFETYFVSVQDFIQNCNGEQIRAGSNLFADLCHNFTQSLISSHKPFRGLFLVREAIQKLQMFPEQLTSIHTDLCELSLSAKCFSAVTDILELQITEINKENNAYTEKHLLLYFYYGGLIFAALKKWENALYFLEQVMVTPAVVMSQIMLEAYKKYILVSVILLGKVRPLPKYKSNVVSRLLIPLAQPYHDLAAAYAANDAEEVRKKVNQGQQMFTVDDNMGLVKQCLAYMYKKNIQRLTKTFLTLSLANIAARVKLPGPAEAEKYVVEMISDGEIYATINHKNGMVSFLDTPDTFGSAQMLANLDAQIEASVKLEQKLQSMDTEIVTSQQFIVKSQGVSDEDGSGAASTAAAAAGPAGAAGAGPSGAATTRSQAHSSRD